MSKNQIQVNNKLSFNNLNIKTLSCLMAILILSSIQIIAQKNINGRITDTTGTGIAKVKIKLTTVTDTKVERQTYSYKNGIYNFNRVPFGNYYIMLLKRGFKESVPFYIEVNENDMLLDNIDFIMERKKRCKLISSINL